MSRDEALDILSRPPLSEEEAKELFSLVARKLEVSEEQLKEWHSMPKSTRVYKNSKWLYRFGEKLFMLMGKDKLIRK